MSDAIVVPARATDRTDGLAGDGSSTWRSIWRASLVVLISLAVHIALFALLAIAPGRVSEQPSSSVPVFVDIVRPDDIAQGRSGTARQDGQESRGHGFSATVRPDKLLAASVLADPRSAEALAALSTLEPATRAEQLCNTEAMAQIAALDGAYRPDLLIAYAMGETGEQDGMLVADSAAFRSKGAWRRLSYRCRADRDTAGVSSFEFAVGPPIPEEEWEDLGLPPEGAEPDDD